MTKEMFESCLRSCLADRRLPKAEIDRSIEFYLEMIDDRMEDGMEEEAAVGALESPELLAEQILSEQAWHTVLRSKMKHVYEKSKAPARKVLFWVLSPLWISLLLAVGVLLFCLSVIEGAVFVTSVAAVVGIGACSAVGIGMAVLLFVQMTNPATALALLGIGLFCLGLLILLFIPVKTVLRGILHLHQLLWRTLKKTVWSMGKEEIA